MLTLLLVSLLTLVFDVQVVKASGTIYIRANGSIDPPTANISTVDNITYFLTDNINGAIVVHRNNIVIHGANYTLNGTDYTPPTGVARKVGIWLMSRNNVTIKRMQIKEFRWGIFMQMSQNIEIMENNITLCAEGIRYDDGHFISICKNRITNCSSYGMYFHYPSSRGTLTDNVLFNNKNGINLHWVRNMTLKGNTLFSNNRNLRIEGGPLQEFIHDIDTSNTVEGKPVYYWVNKENMQIPVDAGYVGVVNSTNITIEGLNIKNNGEGILLAHSENSTIRNNTLSENVNGIHLDYSSNNLVVGNNATNNEYGFAVYFSLENIISQNCATNNSRGMVFYSSSNNNKVLDNVMQNNSWGIYLHFNGGINMSGNIINGSRYGFGIWGQYLWNYNYHIDTSNLVDGKPVYYLKNQENLIINPQTYPEIGYLALVNSKNITIEDLTLTSSYNGVLLANTNNSRVIHNTISDSVFSIFLYYSYNNTIYHNNFIDNSIQHYCAPWNVITKGLITWDNGCEGNYWSNFNATDLDGDGIGDTYLPWEGVDYYPLINPYWNPGDVDHDLDVDLYDAVRLLTAYGSKLGSENYNCHCDINEPYGAIDLFDAVLLLLNYGKQYS